MLGWFLAKASQGEAFPEKKWGVHRGKTRRKSGANDCICTLHNFSYQKQWDCLQHKSYSWCPEQQLQTGSALLLRRFCSQYSVNLLVVQCEQRILISKWCKTCGKKIQQRLQKLLSFEWIANKKIKKITITTKQMGISFSFFNIVIFFFYLRNHWSSLQILKTSSLHLYVLRLWHVLKIIIPQSSQIFI